MTAQGTSRGSITRREFLGTMAALAAVSMAPGRLFAQAGKPHSTLGGVPIGVITYSFRSMENQSAEDLLNYLTECGLSSVELMGEPAEQYAGAPTFERIRFPRGQELTEEQRAELAAKRQAQAEEMRKWRTSVSMDKYRALRKMYNDAGVDIYIVKFSSIGPEMSTPEIEYCCNAAKVLGARGITTEISEEKAKFLAPYAARHQIMIGFHNHTQVNPQSWEGHFSHGMYLGMNFDIGHYVAGTNRSPLPIIDRYAPDGRILSLHLKDRKINDGANLPWGTGDTPLALVLQHMKRNQYDFQAAIELEYPIPEGSNAVEEVKKCVAFCREALA
ncbi:MAG TPA: TIM barrel protein [bacterium]|nr:TIM barrel protein [bacterium]